MSKKTQKNGESVVTKSSNPFRGRNMTCIIPQDFDRDTALAITLIQLLCERPVHIVPVVVGSKEADEVIERWKSNARKDNYIGYIEINLNKGKYRRIRKTDSYETHQSLFKTPDKVYSASGRIFRDYGDQLSLIQRCGRTDFYDVFISPLDTEVTHIWEDPIYVVTNVLDLSIAIDKYIFDILNWGQYTRSTLAVLHREKMFSGLNTESIPQNKEPDRETIALLNAETAEPNKYLNIDLWLVIPDNFDADISLSIILFGWLTGETGASYTTSTRV